MREDSPQWIDVGQPASPAEAEALRAIKAILPDGAIAWAWSNLSFISVNGRLAEVDLVLLTKTGLTLIELKGWNGQIKGNQQNWRVGDSTKPNPLFLTDQKAKWLRGLLEYVQPAGKKVPIPFIRAITVLHGKDSKVELDPVAVAHTFGLDGFNVRGVPAFSEYLSHVATDARDVIDLKRAKELVAVIGAAGFSAPPRTRMVGQYAIDRLEPIELGSAWTDVIADNPHMPGHRKRIRLYDVPRGVSEERRQKINRVAQREFLLTRGLTHPGVIAPEDFFSDPQAGPALVFAHDPLAQRLDRWLTARGPELTLDRRLDVLRQLAEIFKYAHARGVTHRALSPHQVFVTESRASAIKVSVRDWQTGREDPGLDRGTSTPSPTVLLGTRHVADLADTQSWVYLAPEVHTADGPDGIALDLYGLGSIGYLLITDMPPAANIGELEERIRGSKGLDPAIEIDGLPDGVIQLIQRATHPDARMDRTPDVAAFIADLDDAERQLRTELEPGPAVDPLQAQADELIEDRFYVKARLGSGSTGLALLVTEDLESDTVLKIAHDATKEPRLVDEYAALQALDSPRVVKAVHEPFRLGGHLAIQLEDAGRPTLGERIRQEGRLTLDQLERYGSDLLEAAAHLDSRGVLHRDIKPDNLGVRPAPGDRRPRLVLFDFSLANEPLDHVKAGTPPYLDPFLGGGRRPRYDRAAERFAISVTLFEMATGQRPVWGSGDADPATITDEVTLAPELFESVVASNMIAYFRKALARDAGSRFGDLAEMAQAWSALFVAADAITRTDLDETTHAPVISITVSTPLEEAGLSARAQSALGRLDVATVGELLATSPFRINNLAGLGEKTRREIQHRIRDWRRALNEPESDMETEFAEAAGLRRGIDSVVTAFRPRNNGRNHAEIRFTDILLGLEESDGDTWPSLAKVATAMAVTRPRVSSILDKLRNPWLVTSDEMGLSDEILAIVSSNGGIAEIGEISRALLATQGSAAAEPARTRQATGVIRAVIEGDLARGGDSRLAARRIGDRVLVAIEPADPDAPPADVALDWARKLADGADALAAQRPIPVRATALDVLRSIDAPPSHELVTDDRLLKLAAAASKTAAVGGRGEIYPRGLDAAEAIRLTLTGTAVSRQGLTPAVLASKVSGRFPQSQELPARPELDRLVAVVDPGLAWNGASYGNSASTSGSLLSTQHGLTVLGARVIGPPYNEINARLTSSLKASGYLTLAIDPRRIERATTKLVATYGLEVVNLTSVLLTAAKQFAIESGIDWGFLLTVDSKEASNTDRAQLDRFVGDVLKQALPPILTEPRPLLLTDAAPLGRYHQEQWLARLADLATPRPAARWVLVPHRPSGGPPTLDSHVAVPLGSDGYLTLGTDFFEARSDAHNNQENAS
jgi:serine/threonine protein kinase